MLQIILPKQKCFDENLEEFVTREQVTLKLEHSLISIHKWEAKWHKPYLHTENFTPEEIMDYIRCMSLDPNLDIAVLDRLTVDDFNRIKEYISDPMTATTIHSRDKKKDRTIVTAEVLYYYMISLDIPFECAKWHLNQLFALIQVCNIKGGGSNKKMSKQETAAQMALLNSARRAKTGSRG